MTVLDEHTSVRNGNPVTTQAARVPAPGGQPGAPTPTPTTTAPAAAANQAPWVPHQAASPAERSWWAKLLRRQAGRPARTHEEEARARARTFCWGWLLFALVASVSGNVAHAWMTAPAAVRMGAAIAAIVPPTVLLGATHMVVLLISTRRRRYRVIDLVVLVVVMLVAVGVAVFAFTISFYSLRDLMIIFGQTDAVAWRWPVAVDLSLVVSSLALLSLVESRIGHADDQDRAAVPATADPAAINGPSTPAERRLWWESIATVVREDAADNRKIAELTPVQLGDVLARMYDRGESGRAISDATGLHHREVKAIKLSADGVLTRTAVTPAPTNAT